MNDGQNDVGTLIDMAYDALEGTEDLLRYHREHGTPYTKRRPYIPNTYYIYAHLIDKVEPLGEIIWNKGYGQVGTAWGSFRSPSDPSLADQHEYILIFRKYGKRGKPEAFEKIPLYEFKSWRNSIWNIAPAKASEVNHVAPFPDEIPGRLVTLYSFAGETILDPFLGSGTTAYCAKILGRKFIGIEIEEKYCKIAADRCRQAVMQLDMTKEEIKQEPLL